MNSTDKPSNFGEEVLLLETERFDVVRLERPQGRPELSRTVIRHPGAVVILPLLGENQVCLIRNRRVSVGKTLLELPAGTCEAGESHEETARRELLEETGWQAGKLTYVHSYFASPGILDEQMHFFVATELTESNPDRMQDEQIENVLMTLDAAYQQIANREIEDAKSIVGLLFYKCFLAQ